MWEPIGWGFTPAGLSNSEFRPGGGLLHFFTCRIKKFTKIGLPASWKRLFQGEHLFKVGMNTALNRDGTYRVPSHISFNSLPFSGEAEDAQSSASFILGPQIPLRFRPPLILDRCAREKPSLSSGAGLYRLRSPDASSGPIKTLVFYPPFP
jgi:hypothetical protein